MCPIPAPALAALLLQHRPTVPRGWTGACPAAGHGGHLRAWPCLTTVCTSRGAAGRHVTGSTLLLRLPSEPLHFHLFYPKLSSSPALLDSSPLNLSSVPCTFLCLTSACAQAAMGLVTDAGSFFLAVRRALLQCYRFRCREEQSVSCMPENPQNVVEFDPSAHSKNLSFNVFPYEKLFLHFFSC